MFFANKISFSIINIGSKKISGCSNGKAYWTCEYDSNGNLTRKNYTDDNDELYDISYEYDENGFVTKELTYRDEKFYSLNKYQNDENGRVTKKTICDKNETELISEHYTYDNVGNVIKMVKIADDNSYKGKEKTEFYRYNSDGRLLRIYVYNGNKIFNKVISYDTVGNEVKDYEDVELEYEYYDDGKVKSITAYTIIDNVTKEKTKYIEYDTKGREKIVRTYIEAYGKKTSVATGYEYYD